MNTSSLPPDDQTTDPPPPDTARGPAKAPSGDGGLPKTGTTSGLPVTGAAGELPVIVATGATGEAAVATAPTRATTGTAAGITADPPSTGITADPPSAGTTAASAKARGTAGRAGQRPGLGGAGGGFARLWTASTASAIGDGVSLTAAPLLASTLTDDPRLIAGVTMALTLPYAVFGIPAGVLVDRTELRRAMLGIDFFRGTLMLLLSLSLAYGWAGLPALYACFFLIGTCETFFRNASQVIVPSVVPETRLVEANGRLMGAQTAANQFVGPLLGSALFPLARAVPFALDAVSFYVSAGLLTSLRITCRPAASKATRTGRTGLLGDMATGAAWLLRHRMLRNLAVTAGLLNLVVTGGLAVLVVHARGVLHLGDTGYGLLLACQAVGAVLAARLSPELTRRAGPGWSLVLVALAISAANLVVWLVPSAWAVGPALALTACAGVTWDVVVVVKRQTLIPKELQGRVNSVYRLLAWGAMPIGAALAGVLSKAAGTPAVFAAGAVVTAAMAIRLALGVRAGWLTRTESGGTDGTRMDSAGMDDSGTDGAGTGDGETDGGGTGGG